MARTKDNNPTDLLLIKEAAKEFGVKETRLRQAIRRGGLTAEQKLVEVPMIFVWRSKVRYYLETVRPGPRGPRKKISP